MPAVHKDIFCLVGSFLTGGDLQAMSNTSHGHFDFLQRIRAIDHKHQKQLANAVNPAFNDEDSLLRYYTQLESFEYITLVGKLLLQNDDVFTKKIVRGPVVEHLLTLCGTNVTLAENVVECYMQLFYVTTVLVCAGHDGREVFRRNVRIAPPRGHTNINERNQSKWFDLFFDKSFFPELSPREYVDYLVRQCQPIFQAIQLRLCLRLHDQEGFCEYTGSPGLLQTMHMTTNPRDFRTFLQGVHLQCALNRGQLEAAAEGRRQELCRPPELEEGESESEYSFWYTHATPTSIFLGIRDATYNRCYGAAWSETFAEDLEESDISILRQEDKGAQISQGP